MDYDFSQRIKVILEKLRLDLAGFYMFYSQVEIGQRAVGCRGGEPIIAIYCCVYISLCAKVIRLASICGGEGKVNVQIFVYVCFFEYQGRRHSGS